MHVVNVRPAPVSYRRRPPIGALIGLLLAFAATHAHAQQTVIYGEDIPVFEPAPGEYYVHPRIVGLPELAGTEGPSTPPGWADKRGAFGIGANSTLGGANGITTRLWTSGIFGIQLTLSYPPQFEDQRISIATVPRDGLDELAQIFAAELIGAGGGTDSDVALIDGPTGTAVPIPFNLGIASHPWLAIDPATGTLLLVNQSTEDPDGEDNDGCLFGTGFLVEYDGTISVSVDPFRINDFTFGNILFGCAGFTVWFNEGVSEGRFVVVWESYGSPGDDDQLSSIQARVLATDGTPIGGQFQVNTVTTGFQSKPVIVGFTNGGFVILWQSDASLGNDDSLTSIQARLFGPDGVPLGPEFQVNNEILGFQYDVTAAEMIDGDFIVAWTDYQVSNADIAARRFANDGTPRGDQFRVNTITSGEQEYPSVAALGKTFMVAWTHAGNIYMNGNWILFADDFETADTSGWAGTTP